METTYQTCTPSASFVAHLTLSPLNASGMSSPLSPVTVAPRPAGVVRVDAVRERIAAYGVKVAAFAGDRAFGLAARPRSVPV